MSLDTGWCFLQNSVLIREILWVWKRTDWWNRFEIPLWPSCPSWLVLQYLDSKKINTCGLPNLRQPPDWVKSCRSCVWHWLFQSSAQGLENDWSMVYISKPRQWFWSLFGAPYPGSEPRRGALQLPLCTQWLLQNGKNKQHGPSYTKSLKHAYLLLPSCGWFSCCECQCLVFLQKVLCSLSLAYVLSPFPQMPYAI